MSLDQLPDLRCLVMIDGTVFGNVKDATDLCPMELRLGASLAPFEICDQTPLHLFDIIEEYRLPTADLINTSRSDPAEEIPGDIYACWVNHLEDWTLSGADTIQLMINRHHAPCTVHFATALHVPEVQENMFVEASLACHRAQTTLIITLTDPTTSEHQSVRVPFDNTSGGGVHRSGYAHVRQPLPARFKQCDISLKVEYQGRTDDGNGLEPYLFIADVRAARLESTQSQTRVLEPYWLYGQTAPSQGQWVKAALPNVIAPGQDIDVTLGGASFPLTPMRKPDFIVRENYGHTLVCSSSKAMELVLCIDGEYVQQIAIKEDDTIIRLPNRYLNGHVRHLSFKDKSGSVVVFETHQLMPAIVTPHDVMQRESAAPFPTTLFAQTPHRYAALKATLAHAKPSTDLPQLAHALCILEGGHENVRLEPLRFPVVMNPDVSIIMPAHNKVEVTYLALCSLLLAHNTTSFEVIVVDDASTDATTTLDQLVDGITVIHNTAPQRFVRACNTGAEAARGTYIALLNNDVEVTTGWLDALVDAFDRFDHVGLAGSKLLYPNGDLQDAGGIVWGSGNPWNYGNRQNPNEPRFSYARQADYLCGAALMIRADLWRALGGLSAVMEPMYFEDTDLAFKVREAGYSTWFVPSSTVYHFEGMTSGTDVSSGFKKYQEVNRPKFKRRWASAYASHGTEGHRPDLEKDRGIVGRVLFVDCAPPRADKDAGSYAALQEMKLVQSLGYKVTFVATNMAHLGSYTEALQKTGVEVIYAPFYMNVTEYLTQHARDFDAFYVTRYYVAQAVLQDIRALAPDAKILFNNADLHFLRELRTAQSENDAGKLDHARQTRTEEMEIINAVDVVLSYTDVEHSVIQAYSDGQASVLKCPWVVSVPNRVPAASERVGMSFLGSYRHHPNAEGITWFARTVMPALAAAGCDMPLTIYGSGMTPDIKALATDRIAPEGFIDTATDAYDRHRVSIAPLLSGAGIKGKVLGALARGIPCIVSPIAAEGIGLRSGHDCIIAHTVSEWVQGITALHTDDDLWLSISQNARTYMRGSYSFDQGREKMRAAFEAADMFGSRP